ncbi:MAG: hypothetical protein GX096_01500 [Clostridiales bacterium]|nr:hypothetical protein [Clostridiales bacterium]
MNIQIDLSGMDAIESSIQDAIASILPSAASGVASALSLIEGTAKELCPIDQGELAAGISTSLTTSQGEVVGTVTASAPHSAYVEFGTIKSGAQPFMHPAFELQKDAAMQQIANAISKAVSG